MGRVQLLRHCKVRPGLGTHAELKAAGGQSCCPEIKPGWGHGTRNGFPKLHSSSHCSCHLPAAPGVLPGLIPAEARDKSPRASPSPGSQLPSGSPTAAGFLGTAEHRACRCSPNVPDDYWKWLDQSSLGLCQVDEVVPVKTSELFFLLFFLKQNTPFSL